LSLPDSLAPGNGNKKFNSGFLGVGLTKRQTSLVLGVIALLVIGSAGVGIFLYSASGPTTSSSTSGAVQSGSTGGTWFTVGYDTITVGYNSGLWQLQLQDVSGKQVKLLTATLSTPVESKMCTSVFGGFSFPNCPATPPSAGTFPGNSTFTGSATGIGPGSAKPGTSYRVTIDVVFADGTTRNDTLSVTAAAGG